jgi:uncharacterized membrane protein YidH (DUF202 family)
VGGSHPGRDGLTQDGGVRPYLPAGSAWTIEVRGDGSGVARRRGEDAVQKATKAAWVRLAVSLTSFAVALTATIMTVSALSARDRITLGQGIALFATVLTMWMVAVTVLWVRWWQHRRRGDLVEHDDRDPVPFT